MQIDPRFDEAMRRERGIIRGIVSCNTTLAMTSGETRPAFQHSNYIPKCEPQKTAFDEARKKIDKVRKIDLGG